MPSRVDSPYPKLADALPRLAYELRESLLRVGETELAAQVDEARVHALCACDDEHCLGVYLGPERGPCTGDYRVVTPDAVVTVGVCRERVDWIDDNEQLSTARSDPLRRQEYEALRPRVPSRMP